MSCRFRKQLYVRFLAEALGVQGLNVHLVSSERKPETIVDPEAHVWDPEKQGGSTSLASSGRCVAHRLSLDCIPSPTRASRCRACRRGGWVT